MLAGERERPLVDLRGRRRCRRRARRRRACRGRGGRCGSRTSSGRARAPAGRRCGCPRCRTGRRGTGQPKPAIETVGISVTSASCFVCLVVERAVRLHGAAEMRAVVRDDREARLACRAGRCSGRTPCGARPRPGSCRTSRSRSRTSPRGSRSAARCRGPSDALLEERGRDHEAERRHRDEAADHARRGRASRPRGTSSAGSARRAASRARPRRRGSAARGGRVSGSTSGACGERGPGGQVAHPEERERERDHGAEARRRTTRRSGRRAARPRRRRSRPARGSGPGRAGVRRAAAKGLGGIQAVWGTSVNVVTARREL